jgi:hypothetical protein
MTTFTWITITPSIFIWSLSCKLCHICWYKAQKWSNCNSCESCHLLYTCKFSEFGQLVHRNFLNVFVFQDKMLWCLQHFNFISLLIGICCFSAKHAALRRKSKFWLARNRNNVWSGVTCLPVDCCFSELAL